MENIILEFKKIDTSTISDALDKLALVGQCMGIKSLNPSWKIAGRAFTVKYGPVDIPCVRKGDIIVEDADGVVVVPKEFEEKVLVA
ncbi:MAG: RraA family protein [Firmicutes bacterium]|nr:RraA family protein [Bacillota bacterium]